MPRVDRVLRKLRALTKNEVDHMTPLFRRLLVSLLCLFCTAPVVLHAGDEIILGVFPYVTADQLIKSHAPLQHYIAETLGRPVVLVSAPDFTTFDQRTRQGDYDLVLTAPHFGRVAEKRDGYRRVARTRNEVQAVFLVPNDSPIRRIRDLAGKSVMMAQPVSVLYQLAMQTLRQNGLTPGRNLTILDTRTHDNAILAPLHGEADAGVTGLMIWEKLAGDQRHQLRVIGKSNRVPGLMIMANPRFPSRDVTQLRQALLRFQQTPAGASYFRSTGLEGFETIDDATMVSLDPYTRVITQTR